MNKFKYFRLSEFDCNCGCGTNNISEDLVEKLDKARELAGISFYIVSGSRCSKHNSDVGGVPGSSHTQGTAVDIRATSGSDKFKIVKALLEVGFTRIGVGRSFIHADVDPKKPSPTIWLY